MRTTKPTTHKGFELYAEQFDHLWSWYFRPLAGFQAWQPFPGRKAALLGFLDDPVKAFSLYLAGRIRCADVPKLEKEFLDLCAERRKLQSPGFDPGGNTNNVGAVTRDLKRAAASPYLESIAREAATRACALSRGPLASLNTSRCAQEWLQAYHPRLDAAEALSAITSAVNDALTRERWEQDLAPHPWRATSWWTEQAAHAQ